jgi:hypothetical protein
MTCSYVQCIYVLPWLTRYSWPAPTCNVLMYCLGSCRYGWPAPTCNVLMYGLDTCRYGWPDSTCNALMYWLMQIRDQARRFITLVDELYNNKVIWNTLLHHLLCPRCSNGFLVFCLLRGWVRQQQGDLGRPIAPSTVPTMSEWSLNIHVCCRGWVRQQQNDLGRPIAPFNVPTVSEWSLNIHVCCRGWVRQQQ